MKKSDVPALGWAMRVNRTRWSGVSYVPGHRASTDMSGAVDLARLDAMNAQSRRQGSNLQRPAHKAGALPVELRRPAHVLYSEADRRPSRS